MRHHHAISLMFLLYYIAFLILPTQGDIVKRSTFAFHYLDALIPPDLPSSMLRGLDKDSVAPTSPSPGYYETSEYLIGSVAVGIIFPESNGTVDPSTENWVSPEESKVISEIQYGFSWLARQNPSAMVSFKYDIHYRVPTRYEPINQPYTRQYKWISDVMSFLGYSSTDYFSQVRNYANILRTTLKTDWSFVIFVVDSSNDPDGKFTDGYFAYAYIGGPFLVMTYDNNGWGIDNMDNVVVHESLHIFYATDEYDWVTEYSGYLNVRDDDGAYCIMNPDASSYPIWSICASTKEQIGWRDSDGDGIQDIVDTVPRATLTPYSPDPTNNYTLTYSGTVTEVPYPNTNPYGSSRDVTINKVVNVEYRVNSDIWMNTSVVDGVFDEAEEKFTFTFTVASSGIYYIEARGRNSVGNVETSFAFDSVKVDLSSPTTVINYSIPFYQRNVTLYVSNKTMFFLTASDAISEIANTYYMIDFSLWKAYKEAFDLSDFQDGIHTIYFYSIDKAGNIEATNSFEVYLDNSGPVISLIYPFNGTILRSTNVSISWQGLDVDSGIAYYETRIDFENYVNKGNSTDHVFTDLNEGNHYIYVRAIDKLGNLKEVFVNVLIDKSPPSIEFISPKNGSEIKSSSVLVAWNGWDELSEISQYEIRLNNDLWTNVGTNMIYNLTELSDGNYIISIKAVDKAGNYRETQLVFSVNTSIFGGPGWNDDYVIFGMIGCVIIVTLSILVVIKKRRDNR